MKNLHGPRGQGSGWPILGLCASSRGGCRALFSTHPSKKVQPMDQITNWMQSNWYELGSLTAQFTFLFAGLWFAVKILKAIRATQEQMGALLRLSMTDGLEDRSKATEAPNEPAPSVVASSMFSPAPERSTSYAAFEKATRTEMPSLSNELSGRAKASTQMASVAIAEAPITPTGDPTPYVAAPLTMPEEEHSGGHLKAAVQWLQTPMPKKQKNGNPLKKVVRWLQEPAR